MTTRLQQAKAASDAENRHLKLELETLRAEAKEEGAVTVKSDGTYLLRQIAGDTIEVKVVMQPGEAKELVLRKRSGHTSTWIRVARMASS